jgi:type II secretory pathway pseudopilin PulG
LKARLLLLFIYKLNKERKFIMLKGYFSNKKGMALVMVLMVMVVLSILGVVILQVCLAETKFTARDNKSKQAYYLAKSGVEATATWMLDNSNNGAALVGKDSEDTVLSDDIEGTFKVEVLDNTTIPTLTPDLLLIKGTGTVDDVSASAGLILKRGGLGSGSVFRYSLYSEGILLLNGNTTIEGAIGAGEAVTEHGHVTAPEPVIEVLNYPPPIFPADPSTASSDTLHGELHLNMAGQPYVYKDFIFQPGGSTTALTFDTGDDPHNVVNLVVERLYLRSGVVKITGSGKANIFIALDADFDVDTNYNDPLPSNRNQLMVYLREGASAAIDGNRKFNGFIYGPGATITLGGNGGFDGAIIGGSVTASGTPFVHGSEVNLGDIIFDDLPIFNYVRSSWVKP